MRPHNPVAVAARALEAAVARWSGRQPQLLVLPVPLAAAERVWDALPTATATYWRTQEGVWAGLGTAWELHAEGPDRLQTLAAALGQLQSLHWQGTDGNFRPLCFAGAAFAPGTDTQGLWGEFGEARVLLPRWTYHVAGRRAALVLALGPGAAHPNELVCELEAIGEALVRPSPVAKAHGNEAIVHEEEEAAWHSQVAAARAAIAAGLVRKVVLVRRTHVQLAAPVRGSTLLRRLRGKDTHSFCFGFRFGDSVFAGASPELLVARRGLSVQAEALAASLPRPPNADARSRKVLAARLLADPKQRHEHTLVVEALQRELAKVCAEVHVSSTPKVRVLRHLLHLSTPISGRLQKELGVLELAARLHPTPAVAGEPREEAMAFIASHERHTRGWFAGPVGRVEANGDGELAVALRSVLVRGHDAYVYAGAGLVANSHADTELAETRAKARTCLEALGVHE